MVIKTAAIDTSAFVLSSVIAIASPVLFTAFWITLIVISKTMFTHEQRRAHDYLRALVIGAPIGVLASMICLEHSLGYYSSIGVGALVAIAAEQIFKGEWFVELYRALIDGVKSRISK